MRYPDDQKAKTRKSILDAAGRIFRRRGYHAGGVDAVMKEAGLTHGGFYSHFRNKEALLAETVAESMGEARQYHRQWTEGKEGDAWLRGFFDHYLSPEHRRHVEEGCPAPTLISELDRVGDDAKRRFEDSLQVWGEDIGRQLEAVAEEDRETLALGAIAASVGGMAVARAVADPALADRVLEGARELIFRAVIGEAEDAAPSQSDGGNEADESSPLEARS